MEIKPSRNFKDVLANLSSPQTSSAPTGLDKSNRDQKSKQSLNHILVRHQSQESSSSNLHPRDYKYSSILVDTSATDRINSAVKKADLDYNKAAKALSRDDQESQAPSRNVDEKRSIQSIPNQKALDTGCLNELNSLTNSGIAAMDDSEVGSASAPSHDVSTTNHRAAQADIVNATTEAQPNMQRTESQPCRTVPVQNEFVVPRKEEETSLLEIIAASHDVSLSPSKKLQESSKAAQLVHSQASTVGSQHMTNPPLSYPSLHLVPYGVNGNHGLDVFSLPHNAIRKEMSDVYVVLGYFQQQPLKYMSIMDFSRASDFISQFLGFLTKYLASEEELLFPWLKANILEFPPASVSDEICSKERKELALLVTELFAFCQKMKSTAESAIVTQQRLEHAWWAKIMMDNMAGRLVQYFSLQERVLPRYVQANIKAENKAAFDKTYASFFAQGHDDFCPDTGLYLAMLSQWLKGSPTRSMKTERVQVWRYDSLNFSLYTRYPSAERKYSTRYRSTVQYLKSRRENPSRTKTMHQRKKSGLPDTVQRSSSARQTSRDDSAASRQASIKSLSRNVSCDSGLPLLDENQGAPSLKHDSYMFAPFLAEQTPTAKATAGLDLGASPSSIYLASSSVSSGPSNQDLQPSRSRSRLSFRNTSGLKTSAADESKEPQQRNHEPPRRIGGRSTSMKALFQLFGNQNP